MRKQELRKEKKRKKMTPKLIYNKKILQEITNKQGAPTGEKSKIVTSQQKRTHE